MIKQQRANVNFAISIADNAGGTIFRDGVS